MIAAGIDYRWSVETIIEALEEYFGDNNEWKGKNWLYRREGWY